MTSKRIMIIAGEASGDLHAAKLVAAVQKTTQDISFFGIGGPDMRRVGVETLVDARDIAVVGLVEILAHRKVIFAALKTMQTILKQNPPDLLVLVDYPEFNLRLAKTAKQCGVKVLYYISPQVWAWRQHRVKTIRERVDHMAVVFPFEEEFYRKHHVPVTFVGHPLVEEVKPTASIKSIQERLGLIATQPVVGLFPGSRHSEIKRLFPIILESARRIFQQQPNVNFVLPLAPTLNEQDLAPYLAGYDDLPIKIVSGQTYDIICVCDAIITVSGTVTLEIALLHTPMVIINKVAWLTYAIVSRMLKIDHIGLCNIVAQKRVVPELIQHNATPEKIASEIFRFLRDQNYRDVTRENLAKIEGLLGKRGGSETAARVLLNMVSATSE